MKYLLDTNAWFRLVQAPEEIATPVQRLMAKETSLALSPMSLIEVAQKWSKSPAFLKAPLEEWKDRALAHSIDLLPITALIAHPEVKTLSTRPA